MTINISGCIFLQKEGVKFRTYSKTFWFISQKRFLKSSMVLEIPFHTQGSIFGPWLLLFQSRSTATSPGLLQHQVLLTRSVSGIK